MKKIKIYNINQFNKTGKLKKKAQAEISISIGGETTQDEIDHSNKQIAETLKTRGYHSFESPYIFTHILAQNAQNERVFIFESVIVGSDQKEITTSPVTLYKLLTK